MLKYNSNILHIIYIEIYNIFKYVIIQTYIFKHIIEYTYICR